MRLSYKRNKCKSKAMTLRTTQELADEFGVKVRTLHGYFATCPEGRPLPVFRHGSAYAGYKTYYELKQARSWWSTVCEKYRNPEHT
jgi:hypothetical protein